jgi:hypothetical protein
MARFSNGSPRQFINALKEHDIKHNVLLSDDPEHDRIGFVCSECDLDWSIPIKRMLKDELAFKMYSEYVNEKMA